MKNFIQHTAESMDQNESSHQLELPVIDETIDGSKLIESINKALYIIGKRPFKKLSYGLVRINEALQVYDLRFKEVITEEIDTDDIDGKIDLPLVMQSEMYPFGEDMTHLFLHSSWYRDSTGYNVASFIYEDFDGIDEELTAKSIANAEKLNKYKAIAKKKKNSKGISGKEKDEIMKSMGMTKVKGSLGGTYWE